MNPKRSARDPGRGAPLPSERNGRLEGGLVDRQDEVSGAPQPVDREWAILRYTVVPEQGHRLPDVYPRHRAYLDDAARSGDLLFIGTFENPVINGSQGVFRSTAAAERFAAADPFRLEGLVEATVLAWDVLDFGTA